MLFDIENIESYYLSDVNSDRLIHPMTKIVDFNFEFNQKIRNPDDDHKSREKEREGAFYAQDYSRITSNTAKRARKLAKPTWSDDTGRGDSDFGDLLDEEHVLNNTIDFTFQYRYRGTGDWSNYKDYEVTVADQTAVAIPEKESMYNDVTIPITSIKKRKNEPSN